MNKYISFLTFFLAVLFCFKVNAQHSIYMALWDGCDSACKGFQDYIKSSKLDVDFVVRDAKKNVSKIPDFVQEVKSTKQDLLVTWGTLLSLEMLGTETQALSGQYVSSIPAVFMVVSQPVASGLLPSLVNQGRSITGAMNLVPITEQLQLAQQFMPFKRMGILYNPQEINAVVTKNRIKQSASLMGIEVVDHAIPLVSEKPIATSIDTLVAELASQNVDLIYLGTDVFMNTHRQRLTDASFAFNIPVYSASSSAVKEGDALFSFVYDYYTIGQLAGQKAVKILKDKIPAYDINIETPHRPMVVVNMSTAKKLGIYPPLSMLNTAKLVD